VSARGSLNVIGAVLAGGRSSRMGADKATMLLDGRPMAEHSVGALREAGIGRILLSGGGEALARELGAELVPDIKARCGPLGGLHAVLSRAVSLMASPDDMGSSGDDVVVVLTPCDVPGVLPADLRAVQDSLVVADLDVVCVVGPLGREPLISAWRPHRCLAAVADRLNSNRRSVHGVLEGLNVGEVLTGDPASLHNVNEPADLPSESGR